MTIPLIDLLLYAGAVAVLFLTPGPVWMALVARGISGGFWSAWPLAFGVAIGDAVWPFIAILGVSWVVGEFEGVMTVLRYVAVGFFVWMGVTLIRSAGHAPGKDTRLTRPGMWAGFLAGVVVILSNPKAILFYMGVLPGFFDLRRMTGPDIAAIVVVSIIVPLIGNTGFALFVDRMRALMTSPAALRRLNAGAGLMLISVGLIIAFL